MSSPQLLLDENLSERLLPLLIERFPGSTHVRLIGLGGLVLVTKDDDFLDLSVSRGCPPKVVCLAIGNASNAAPAMPLRRPCCFSKRRRSSGSAHTGRPAFCCCGLQPECPTPPTPSCSARGALWTGGQPAGGGLGDATPPLGFRFLLQSPWPEGGIRVAVELKTGQCTLALLQRQPAEAAVDDWLAQGLQQHSNLQLPPQPTAAATWNPDLLAQRPRQWPEQRAAHGPGAPLWTAAAGACGD